MTLSVTPSASSITVVKVRPATLADAEALPTIDRDAGQVFRRFPELAWLADGEGMPVERHRAFIEKGAAWVGVDENDTPVGFLDAEVAGDELHVWEMSVHRDWQGRGLGRALMAAASDYAARTGLAALTLTTFRDVPWNGPFYERLGFATIPSTELSARLKRVLVDEVAGGLPEDRRCAMRRIL
ncbi:GNAT family N-acetyltransferase [Pandoraea pneumonica]|uniref:GNAT family N-acetyltransferase n=1 Tax=Pandoraea pneumonica TaxID=2508299 RepID=A0A5E4RQI7_9BURK|nr:GNAT family N-acetyltransferase [Pandoraea pneumonica]VVD65031.1 GNAT family N-acetyltransferase [Pandoraea pneumonica]